MSFYLLKYLLNYLLDLTIHLLSTCMGSLVYVPDLEDILWQSSPVQLGDVTWVSQGCSTLNLGTCLVDLGLQYSANTVADPPHLVPKSTLG